MNRVFRHALKQTLVALSWLFFFSWFDWLAVRLISRQPSGGLLLVKMDAIGDFVLAAPVLRAVIQSAGAGPVTLFCDGRAAVLARLLFPAITVVGVDVRRFLRAPSYRWRLLRQARVTGAGTAVNLALSPELWWGDSLIRASAAPRRLGIAGFTDRIAPPLAAFCASWYTRTVAIADPDAFAGDALRGCVETLGFAVPEMRAPDVTLPAEAAAKVPVGPYFAVAPGSLRAIKQWPVEKFAELAGRVVTATGWTCVLLGAPSDAAASQAAGALIGPQVVDLTGRTSLVEALAILKGARLLIANDSALVHMAALCGVQVVSTLGGGHPGRFLPYSEETRWLAPAKAVLHPMPCFNCDWQCIYPVGDSLPAPCITGIPLAAMWDAVRETAKLP